MRRIRSSGPVAKHEVDETSEVGKSKGTQGTWGVLSIIFIFRTVNSYRRVWHMLQPRKELLWDHFCISQSISDCGVDLVNRSSNEHLKEGNAMQTWEVNSCGLERSWM